jgi:hypothetical protein
MSATISASTAPVSSSVPTNGRPDPSLPTEVARVLDIVERHLAAAHIEAALEVLRRTNTHSAWITNATAVCHLRAGHPTAAITALRPLATTDGLYVRDEVPPAFAVNLAVGHLLAGNLGGFTAILKQVREEEYPAVKKYWQAYRDWRKRLSFLQRLRFELTWEASTPVRLEFSPGELR